MAKQQKEKSKYDGLTLVKGLIFNPITKKVVKKEGFNGKYPVMTSKDIEDVLSQYDSVKELEYRKDKLFQKVGPKKVQKLAAEETVNEETG